MKNHLLCLLVSSLCSLLAAGQSVNLIIQPDASSGKDAFLRSLSPQTNFGEHPDVAAIAWTYSGSGVLVRSLLDFDISRIPVGATVQKAELFLYGYESSANTSHSNMSGSNKSTISRITTPWNEQTVTWQTQPEFTLENQITLNASTNPYQDYRVDVTELMQDMVNAPASSFGFILQLENEAQYRKMVFASSDNPDASKRPKLAVRYIDSALSGSPTIRVFPSPTTDILTVDLSAPAQPYFDVTLINAIGQIVFKETMLPVLQTIDVSHFASGIYHIEITSNNFSFHEKIVFR